MNNILKMKKLQIKSVLVLVLVFTLLSTLTYSLSTTLQSPADNFADDDGFLDLRASCEPTSENSYDGTTSWNITDATLYSDVQGSWKANRTIQVANPIANSTYYFNFTNSINQTSEGQFTWDVQCNEANSTNDGLNIGNTFADDRRNIKVEYAKPTVEIISPADGSFDLDGHDISIICLSTPTPGWNITQIELKTNMSLDWKPNQTFTIPIRSVSTRFAHTFILNAEDNRSGDGTNIVFGCSATQIKNDLEGAPISETDSSIRTLNMGDPQQCTQGVCDLITKQWCNNGMFVSDGYCDACGGVDTTCTNCVGNSCDTINQKWCENDLWKGGSYSQYCSHCGYTDNNCPICEEGVCDLTNQKTCKDGAWSVIDYCIGCGTVDANCGITCENGACDTENRKVCNNGVWEESNYCFSCGSQDSSCAFECTNNACDTKNKQWCNNGVWSDVDYCNNCGAKDFTCGVSCLNNACDTASNRWCDSGSWSFLNYCGHCEDSECLDICVNNACDVNGKKWCDSGSWSDVDYCDNCGNKDSSCLVACQEDVCDTTANKRCSSGSWITTNYCDYCALEDSDCAISCAEGECDTTNKKACTNGKWNATTYTDLCVIKEINVTIMTCNDHGNCTIGFSCSRDSECDSGSCADNKCVESTCSNGIKDSDETDIDCGGECDKCRSGRTCIINLDCSSNLCDSGICVRVDRCDDGILNGDETGIDCGGTCQNKCRLGRTCNVVEDCESTLTCVSGTCAEPGIVADQDTDGDGIPDEWELDNGLDPSDPSDAYADFDGDGLTNIQEYTFGTNPNRADSDNDAVSDKDEIINEGTDPLDPVSKPGGIGGLLFFIIILIIVFGAGSYAFYYYKDNFIKPKVRGPIGPTFMEKSVPQQRQVLRKPIGNKSRMEEIVKKRREQKEEKRQKLFESFGGKVKTLKSQSKGKTVGKKPQNGVFLKLEEISKKK